MESHQLMQTSCWALRVSVLGRSSLGSLSTLLLGVQSIPRADSTSLGLNMKAGAKQAAEHLFPSQDSGRTGQGVCVPAHRAAALSKPSRTCSPPRPQMQEM